MQFKEGAPVYTADGQKVGDIERFILDPRARQIIGLVVRKGFFFTEDKVIPINMVGTADPERVTLYADAGEPKNFPTFEETHYLPPASSEVQSYYEQRYTNPLYYRPPLDTVAWYGGVYRVPVKERNIPEGTVPVKEGASVMSLDGEHIGDVKRIYTDAKSDEITHFKVTEGLLFPEEKYLPAEWVQNAHENRIQLAVSSKTLEKLGSE